jgi:alkaline phosphatase D
VARPEEAHSVHVEVSGLRPSREYHYRLMAGREVSAPGRTRTAPPAWAPVSRLRFAFASCQNYPVGYFNAYADVVAQDVDLVVHLGDYIYEGPTAQLRAHAPATETMTLPSTTGSATPSTRPTSTCRPRMPPFPGW